MLTHLTINDFAIVDRLDLDLPDGLVVVTGETGAGKSIMVDALQLALGGRGDSGWVSHGAKRADILAEFDIRGRLEISAWLEEHAFDVDGECILRRVIAAEGRSRSFINGVPCTLNDLKRLGQQLVSIHGQHEHQKLMQRDTHRQLLDHYGQHQTACDKTARAYKEWQQHKRAFEDLRDNASELQSKLDFLSFQCQELDELDLQADELVTMESAHKRLTQTDELIQFGQAVTQLLSDNDNSVESVLASVTAQLNQLNAIDPRFNNAVELVENARVQLQEAAMETRDLTESTDMDAEALQEMESRLSTVYQLARKHRVEASELYSFHQQLKADLAAIQFSDDDLENLERQAQQAFERYLDVAGSLSKARLKTAKTLGKAITQQIKHLGMPGAVFSVECTELPEAQYQAQGMERVEFHIRSNPGQPAKPINKIASGGELSRISLAIQALCADKSTTPTLVFDEVDVGIGGGVAEIVGQLLRRLGQQYQVLCVTHLPQVAAQGHHHLQVEKQTKKSKTHTQIQHLSVDEKVVEIARMLGGLDITEQSLAHAKSLIAVPGE